MFPTQVDQDSVATQVLASCVLPVFLEPVVRFAVQFSLEMLHTHDNRIQYP